MHIKILFNACIIIHTLTHFMPPQAMRSEDYYVLLCPVVLMSHARRADESITHKLRHHKTTRGIAL